MAIRACQSLGNGKGTSPLTTGLLALGPAGPSQVDHQEAATVITRAAAKILQQRGKGRQGGGILTWGQKGSQGGDLAPIALSNKSLILGTLWVSGVENPKNVEYLYSSHHTGLDLTLLEQFFISNSRMCNKLLH